MRKRRKPTRAKQLGVNDAEYAVMFIAQDGVCAICHRPPKTKRLHVDHDHRGTGRVRALLCFRCNRSLPYWATPEWLRDAADYLERYAA